MSTEKQVQDIAARRDSVPPFEATTNPDGSITARSNLRFTPAPLDPKAVKAGDTVTVHVLGLPDMPDYDVTGEVYEFSRPGAGLPLHVGGHSLSNPSVTLTAHTPAPEPEPEWKPGTTGTAEVVREGANGGPRVFRKTRGMIVHRPAPIDDDMFVTTEGEMWSVEGLYCKGFVPDEPRPLPTREQVKAALEPGWGRDSITAMVDAVLALLRGESR